MKTSYLLWTLLVLSSCKTGSKEAPNTSNTNDIATATDVNNSTTTVNTYWIEFLNYCPLLQTPKRLDPAASATHYKPIPKDWVERLIHKPSRSFRYVGKIEAPNYWLITVYCDPFKDQPAYYMILTYDKNGIPIDQEVIAGIWEESYRSEATIINASTIEALDIAFSDAYITYPEPLKVQCQFHINASGKFETPTIKELPKT